MYTSTQQADDAWDEYFSSSDDRHERYHREREDLRINDMIEQQHYHDLYCAEQMGMLSYDKDGVPCMDEYYEYWNRLNKYAAYETTK